MPSEIVKATGLSRVYDSGPAPVTAVSGVSLAVRPGSLVVVKGRSGSGKTTLLNLLGGLDQPTTGTVEIDGKDLSTLDERQRAELRRDKVGFIFQTFGLIPILTAAENVEVPMRLKAADPSARSDRARMLLERVGLAERLSHRPEELSGGEQQRVAIARALANEPPLLIADEPTGQLDSRTGRTIMDLLVEIVHGSNMSAIVATHDPAPLELADRVIELIDGEVLRGTAA